MTENEALPLFGPARSVPIPAVPRKGTSGVPGRARRAGWSVLLVALPPLAQAVFFLKLLLEYTVVRNQASQPEGAGVFAFLTSFRLHRFYGPPLSFPWNAQVFGPLYYEIGTFAARACHGEPTPTTILMRSVSFASLLGSLAIVGYLSWRLERRKLWAAIAVIFALDCSWLVPFAAASRPDTPSIFLALAGLLLYETAETGHWPFYLSGALCACAILTKQTMAAVPLAMAIDCLWARKLSRAATLVAGGATAAVVILLPLWLRHEPFLANLLVPERAVPARDWGSIPGMLGVCLRMNAIAWIGIFFALLGAALSWREGKYRRVLLLAVIAWLSSAALLVNLGGNYNYLILPWFATVLLVPAGLKRLERSAVQPLLISFAIFLFGALIVFLQKALFLHPRSLSPGPVAKLEMLTDNSYLELRSRDPQLLDPFVYNQLSQQGAWSDASIRHKIDAEGYDLLLIGGGDGTTGTEFFAASFRGMSVWGAALLREMSLHYRPLCETSSYLALVPMNRTAPLDSNDVAGIFREPCVVTSRTPMLEPGSS